MISMSLLYRKRSQIAPASATSQTSSALASASSLPPFTSPTLPVTSQSPASASSQPSSALKSASSLPPSTSPKPPVTSQPVPVATNLSLPVPMECRPCAAAMKLHHTYSKPHTEEVSN